MRRKATLISRETKDGWDWIKDEVPLGKVYYADAEDTAILGFRKRKDPETTTRVVCVKVYDTPDGDGGGYFPRELLKIEMGA
jgi:hypothetical protein